MMKNLLWCLLIIGLISVGVPAQPELDTTFNSTGKVIINVAGYSGAWNVAVQPDNKVIVVSGCSNDHGSFPVCTARLNADGSVDTTYGNFGQPENLPGAVLTRYTESLAQNGQATAIALMTDGKIVVTGTASGEPYNNWTAMVRYNGDGSLDTTFGNGGKIFANITGSQNAETVRAVAVQPDGKIVITGDSMRIIPPPNFNNIWSQFVARFLPNGTLDPSFGIGGIVKSQTGSTSASGQSLAIQPDSKILVGGNLWVLSFAGPPYQAYYVARLNSNGTGDQNWSTPIINYSQDGVGPADGIRSVAVKPDGRVVALGFATNRIFQFMPDGSPDTNFDSDGARSVFIVDEKAYNLAVSADGRITVVGMSRQGASWVTNFPYLIQRLMPDGSDDGTFGAGGRLSINFSPATLDGARAIALDQSGRAVIAGLAADATNQNPWGYTHFSALRLTASAIVPAPATITGRVLTADRLPVSGVTMKMTDGSGAVRLARTNPFGYYQFTGVMSGQLYSISVKSRAIAVSERALFLAGDVLNFDFTGAPQPASKGALKEGLIRFK